MDTDWSGISKIAGYVFMALTLISAMGAVTLPRLFHAAIALALTLAGSAVLYFLLHAGFLAAAQLLFYTAAFSAVLFYTIRSTGAQNDGETSARWKILCVPPAFAFLFFALKVFAKTPWPLRENAAGSSFLTALFADAAFPLCLLLIIFITVGIGAAAIAKKDPA